jgi:hypothetical protein
MWHRSFPHALSLGLPLLLAMSWCLSTLHIRIPCRAFRSWCLGHTPDQLNQNLLNIWVLPVPVWPALGEDWEVSWPETIRMRYNQELEHGHTLATCSPKGTHPLTSGSLRESRMQLVPAQRLISASSSSKHGQCLDNFCHVRVKLWHQTSLMIWKLITNKKYKITACTVSGIQFKSQLQVVLCSVFLDKVALTFLSICFSIQERGKMIVSP